MIKSSRLPGLIVTFLLILLANLKNFDKFVLKPI